MSDNFIEASRENLKELLERPLDELQLYAVLIDGTPFRDRQMIVALGISHDERKTLLGLREGLALYCDYRVAAVDGRDVWT